MNIVSTYSPNIIEVFPGGYNVYRKNSSNGYGGVFLACHQSVISCELDIPLYLITHQNCALVK